MKYLLPFLFLFILNNAFSQYSDTTTCISGLDELTYVINYDQQHCIDTCDGSYSIQVLVGSGSYTYQVTGDLGYSSVNAAADSLCPENFVCIVTDLTTGIACTSTFSVDSLQPLTYSLDLLNASAVGECDGEAEISASGGAPPYIVTWYDAGENVIPNQSDLLLDSLCVGDYFFTFTDSQSCPCVNCVPCDSCPPANNNGLIPFSIYDGTIDVVVDWTIDELCPWMCDGMAGISASGGSGNYTFDVGVGSNNNGQFDYLCPSGYTVTVTDDQGNSGTADFIIFEAFSPWVDAQTTNETCFESCDGTITIDDIGGSMIEYSNDGGATFQPSPTFNNLCPGTYDLWGVNYNFCLVPIYPVTIIAGVSPVINSVTTSATSAPGFSDGCITQVDVSGGNPPYAYTVNGVPMGSLPSCGFSTGIYNVCVTDANVCETCESVLIEEGTIAVPLSIQTGTITDPCPGACNATVVIEGTGGVGPFVAVLADQVIPGNIQCNTYTDSTWSFPGLCAGDYIATVTDNNGVTSQTSFTIDEPFIDAFVTSDYSGYGISCYGNADGSASVVYLVNNYDNFLGVTWSINEFTDNISGLIAGTYLVDVSYMGLDEFFQPVTCMMTSLVDVTEPSAVSVSTNIIVEYTEDNCIGSIEVNGTGGVVPYTYEWNECNISGTIIETTQTINDLCAGVYQAKVIDANGCRVSSECDTIRSILGFSAIENMSWSIFPNPADEVFIISTDVLGEYSIVMYDITGKIINRQRTDQSKVQIDIKDLNIRTGVYFVEIIQDGLRTKKRIVIQ